MNKIKAIAVDDEPLSLRGLAIALRAHCDIDLIDTLLRPADGLEAIETHRPELVFLDISMPGLSGLELAQRIQTLGSYVIFLTAHAEHGRSAFDAGASDYLTKPVNDARLALALDRARSRIADRRAAGEFDRLLHMVRRSPGQSEAAATGAAPTLRFRDGERELHLRADEIQAVQAERDFVAIITHGRRRLISATMKQMEQELPSDWFERIHRSSIVNRTVVSGTKKDGRDRIVVLLTDGTRLPVGRSYKARAQSLFGAPED